MADDSATYPTLTRPHARRLMTWLAGALAGTILSVAPHAQEQGARPPPGRMRILSVPLATQPPKIDGVLDDAEWKGAALARDFWISSQDRAPAEQTTVLVTADRTHLYVAFRVEDSQPDQIVALETRRDASLSRDDHVVVELDPYLSHREVSRYLINARGTLSDSIAGGRANQIAWKGDWKGASVRTDYGWAAELAIPFEILNFAEGATTFGVNFQRYHGRTRELSLWADTTVQDLPEEQGRLTGLSPTKGRQAPPIAFMPFGVTGWNIDDKNGEKRDQVSTAGIDIRYQPRQNVTGVLSLNPDFSQVEDALTDIDFSYNEKKRADNRPFFQEGAAYFGGRGTFYSNRIPNFDYGAKTFLRASDYQFGALATRSADSRTDVALNLGKEFNATQSVDLALSSTDQQRLRNTVIAAGTEGRQASGLKYSLQGGLSSTDMAAGDGSFVSGSLGWQKDYWQIEFYGNQYTRDYRPELGLINKDLLDTVGGGPFVSYDREFGKDERVRSISGGATWNYRETSDGLLQQSRGSIYGSIEFQTGIQASVSAYGGTYRPVKRNSPRAWADTLNDDQYVSGSLDFNTQSTRFRYGIQYSDGQLGNAPYAYASAYLITRPTATTSLRLTAEQLDYFGAYRQVVATAGWDVTPRHGLYTRYIWSEGDAYFRFAYSWRVARNLDIFAVYDDSPFGPSEKSIKVLATLP